MTRRPHAKGLTGVDVKANVGLCNREFSLMHLAARVHWENHRRYTNA